MDFQQVIEARRSVRKFRDEEVPHEVLAQAIEAALHAPSSRNSRSTRFLAVRDAATVHRMAAMATTAPCRSRVLRRPWW